MLVHQLFQKTLQRTPDKVACICQDAACTYREIDENSQRFARGLLHLGVQRGDRVALYMHNILEIAYLYMACSKIGAIAVPVSCYSQTPELVYALNHCEARLLLCSRALHPNVPVIGSQVPCLQHTFVIDDSDAAWEEVLRAAPREVVWPHVEPADPALILYTSGSTNKPKGVTHTQRSLWHCAQDRCTTLGLTYRDTFLNTGYLCHDAASTTALLPMLYVGGTAIFPYSFQPEVFLEMVARCRPTFAAASPSQIQAILEHPGRPQVNFSCLKYWSAEGDIVPEQLHENFRAIMKFPLSESIGMAECSTYMTTPPGEPHKPGSMGKPVRGVKVRLVDEVGLEVGLGEAGEIVVRSDTMMDRYWKDPVHTARVLKRGWLHTGNLARQDEDGYYFFVERINQA